MLDFQQKVDTLRRYESLCYNLCVTLLVEEQSACQMAEQVLCRLFANNEFWQTDAASRPAFILRLCTNEFIVQKQASAARSHEFEFVH